MPDSSANESPYSASTPNATSAIEKPIINRLPAISGIHWFFDGFNQFFQAPLIWTGIGFINILLLIVSSLLVLIPILGIAITHLFYPLFIAGFMQAAANQKQENIQVSDYFSGFSSQTSSLFLCGALYFAMLIVVMVITFVFMLVIDLGLSSYASQSISILTPRILESVIGGLISIGLMLPVIMAIWFAPALIILHHHDAIEAIKLSFVACYRNFVPYLAYSLIATLILALYFGIQFYFFDFPHISSLFKKGPDFEILYKLLSIVGLNLLMGTWIAPIFFAGVYSSFNDIFSNGHQENPTTKE
ncbi:BPSS1780 family membrane protein [Pleionea sediminis]|uniref:BPSS1780 family membrane protein n=1 Tax=Pleionea sediminis TaxID=2569479 RepID=UPI00118479AE|nr:BPSS1780 family membrane protein [Pleionea sediminis]